jgi:dTDP-4-amino-4,6-dideoxygalactose transaminase
MAYLKFGTRQQKMSALARPNLVDFIEFLIHRFHRFSQIAQKSELKKRYKASPSEIRSAVVNEFHKARVIGGEVAEDLFDRGLCLPSGTAMFEEDLDRVVSMILKCSK